MLTLILSLRLLAASQVLLFAVAFCLSENPLRMRVSGFLLALGAISYFLLPLMEPVSGFTPFGILVLFAQTVPLLLFYFIWQMFEDVRVLPTGIRVAVLFYLVISFWVGWQWRPQNGAEVSLLVILVQIAKLAWATGAIYVIWNGRKYDLVEARLKLRLIVGTSLGIMVVSIVAVELVTGWQVPEILELFGMAAILLAVAALNLMFMKVNTTVLFFDPEFQVPEHVLEDPTITKLTSLMLDTRLYAEHELRIADVAAQIGVPEYQMRRLINQKLGYRNFNQFINRYRIDEASIRLISEPSLPVLTIALDVGFRSISSFNDAFRLRHDCPPTDYRNRVQQAG